jgi:hypothetical protein
MRTEQTPQWFDDLISSESRRIVKQAKDDKLADIEKRIEAAETPEELDALEKELSELESGAKDDDSTEKEDEAGADAEQKAKPEAAAASNEADDEGADEDADDEEDADDVDLNSLMKEVKDIKKDATSGKDEVQRKLLTEVERLNDEMGLNKIVDMNTTVDEQ